ncbi:hypothetical protein RAB80_018038 [Fusarium oxysporum f. sp. vasinfectum]|nr:hypothetical protein RAB80_018038 [Fusarium oxysporum f. sp. vasinfectum]
MGQDKHPKIPSYAVAATRRDAARREFGLLGGSRDVGPAAEKVFHADVPTELVKLLEGNWDDLPPEFTDNFPTFAAARVDTQRKGLVKSWEQHFGKSSYTDELFMAYHCAWYVEKIAAAGKEAYNIPLFTNAWLPMPGTKDASGDITSGGAVPGEYLSGGRHLISSTSGIGLLLRSISYLQIYMPPTTVRFVRGTPETDSHSSYRNSAEVNMEPDEYGKP